MTQTPISKAIEQLSQYHVKYDHLDNMLISRDDVLKALTELLQYEREVIESAYEIGGIESKALAVNGFSKYKNSTDYFTKTFINNGNN